LKSCRALHKLFASIKSSTPTEPIFFSTLEDLRAAIHSKGVPIRLWLADGQAYTYWKAFIDELRSPSSLLTIQGDETCKTLPKARWLWKKFYQYGIDRGQAVGLIGGGSVLDLGGFCAATWKRGVPAIYVPTTLLAMVDASIGGKTGINFRRGKNLIGVFAPPLLIGIWPEFLKSLSAAELRSGWAEVFKHGLIGGGSLWEALEHVSVGMLPATSLIREAVAVKLQIVQQDPHETQRLRYILNLGHTLGHVWETMAASVGRPLLHGEAVAIGLAQEAYLSHHIGYLPEKDWQALLQWLHRNDYLRPLPPFSWRTWEKMLLQDKKVRAGTLYMPLLIGIGKVSPAEVLAIDQLKAAVRWYKATYGGAD